ncbi:MAG: hypothetical protein KDE08_11105 [Rhodobacteraceae bacterium]|nr:hypothetical protein [Paracoccaceae bacterium]
MKKMRKAKSYGNGFDHMDSKETIRAFISWWNEKSFFPFDARHEEAEAAPRRLAA